MRILFFTDPHIADRPPLGRKEGYREQILDKLMEVGEIAGEHEVGAIICGGDLFHMKRANQVSHYLVQRLQEVFLRYPAPLYLLPGNHDMGPAGLDSLTSQPWGVLVDDGRKDSIKSLGRVNAGIPLSSKGPTLVGRPYNHQRDTDPTYYALHDGEKQLPTPRIVVAHGSIVPPKEDRPYPHIKADEIDMDGITLFLNGHFHEHAPPIKVRGAIYCNPGSLGRTSRTKDNMTRQPQVLVVDTDDTDTANPGPWIEPVLLERSVYPAEHVFLDRPDGGVEMDDNIIQFAEALAEGLVAEEIPLDELIAKLDATKEVKDRVRRYLEDAGF